MYIHINYLQYEVYEAMSCNIWKSGSQRWQRASARSASRGWHVLVAGGAECKLQASLRSARGLQVVSAVVVY